MSKPKECIELLTWMRSLWSMEDDGRFSFAIDEVSDIENWMNNVDSIVSEAELEGRDDS